MEASHALLTTDIIIELFSYVSATDWCNLVRACSDVYRLSKAAPKFVLNSWRSSRGFSIPLHLHSLLEERRLIQLFVILSLDPTPYLTAVDSAHRTLLDLAVDSQMYRFAEWLVGKGFKSNIDAETMFHCIRNHDIRGAAVLIKCGIPVDRFRSRDDGLNVLSCAVMYGSPALVDMFILRGCSIPDGILVQAILSRHSDYHVIDIVSILLDKAGCNPNSCSIMGIPVLHVAIGHSPFAQQLIELLACRGADVNRRSGTEGGGHTPLDISAKKRKRSCYDALVARGAVHSLLYGVEMGDVSIINSYIRNEQEPAPLDQIKFLICFSAAMGRLESVKLLLESHNVLVNDIFVRNDISPLHLAACRGHYSVCNFLVREGINVSAKARGGMDIHIYASNITGSPLWFNPAEYGPNGSLLPPAVRLKTAAELAREAGHEKLARYLDLAMIEDVIVRKDSFDSASSGQSSPQPTSTDHSPAQRRFFLETETQIIMREENEE
jgi:ankyrin repeat protein